MRLLTWLFSFDGRISRSSFWIFAIVSAIVFFVPTKLLGGFTSSAGDLYASVVVIAFVWPGLAIQAKRWHDRDKSGWWILINLIPFVGAIWAFVENGFLRGTAGVNRFGPDPLQVHQNAP